MKNEFVPHEQALVLKELGFNEPCFGFYLEDGEWQPASYSYNGTVYPSNKDLLPSWVSAPLYQQAFRWFRKNYSLHADIGEESDWEENNESWSFDIYKYKLGNNDAMISNCETFNTYEEAELACLIKLIEIVKESLSTDFMNKFFKETWEVVETDIDFSKYEASEIRGSLHVHEERYDIDNETYRLLYSLGHDYPPIIEKLKKEL